MRLYTRAEWGAKYGRGDYNPGPKKNVIVHHTYRPALPASATVEEEMAAMRQMEQVHVSDNGWDGIAYNWVTFQSGRVYEARGWGYRGAHAGPGNSVSEGIAHAIDGHVDTPSPPAIAANRLLIADGLRQRHIAPDYRVSGHRDWMEGRDCPGDAMYRMIQTLRHDASELLPSIIKPSGELAEPPLTAEVIPPNLDRIIVPEPEHFLYAGKVRGFGPEDLLPGLKAVEAVLRIMQTTGVKQVKMIADPLSVLIGMIDDDQTPA